MRSTSTRSAVAIATLAIGSAVLAAVPASAATPSGVTRETVLTIADGARVASDNGNSYYGYSEETYNAALKVVNRVCAVDYDGGEGLEGIFIQATDGGGGADGALLQTYVYTPATDTTPSTYRVCAVGVVATTDVSFSLSGTADSVRNRGRAPAPMNNETLSARAAAPLSGDVFVTAPLVSKTNFTKLSFKTSGSTTRTVAVSSVSQVPDVKSAAQKEAAKDKYQKRIASAKKAYKKALGKADTKAEKAAAKKAYQARRALAKSKFQYAVSSYKNVTKSTTRVENRPFTLMAGFDNTEVL